MTPKKLHFWHEAAVQESARKAGFLWLSSKQDQQRRVCDSAVPPSNQEPDIQTCSCCSAEVIFFL